MTHLLPLLSLHAALLPFYSHPEFPWGFNELLTDKLCLRFCVPENGLRCVGAGEGSKYHNVYYVHWNSESYEHFMGKKTDSEGGKSFLQADTASQNACGPHSSHHTVFMANVTH